MSHDNLRKQHSQDWRGMETQIASSTFYPLLLSLASCLILHALSINGRSLPFHWHPTSFNLSSCNDSVFSFSCFLLLQILYILIIKMGSKSSRYIIPYNYTPHMLFSHSILLLCLLQAIY